MLHDCQAEWSDEAFWSGRVTRRFEGLEAGMLRPEDQIVHLCAHGMRWSPVSPLRWLADVAAVVRAEGERLDLDYLLHAAGRRELVEPVRRTFAWLDRHLDFGADNVMRRALPRLRPALAERIGYVWRVHPPEGLPGMVPAWIDWRREVVEARGVGAEPGGFLGYYARRKKISGRAAAAANLVVMGAKRLLPWAVGRVGAWRAERVSG